MPLNIYNYLKDGIRFPVALVDFVQKVLFDGTFYHLWYLPSLIVAMYVVYVMKNRKFALMLLTTVLMIIGILTDTYGVSFPNLYYSMMMPFSAVVMWTFGEKIGNGWKKILWQSGKIAFYFSISIEMLQLLFRLGTFQLSDIFYNTVGGVIGGLMFCAVMKARKRL